MRVAIFDFDGTIYKHETFKLLMNYLKKHPIYKSRYKSFIIPMLFPYTAYKMKLYKESKMKERSMQLYLNALDQLPIKELNEFFQGIANQMVTYFNEQVIQLFKQHQKEGVYTMVVSGAYTPL